MTYRDRPPRPAAAALALVAFLANVASPGLAAATARGGTPLQAGTTAPQAGAANRSFDLPDDLARLYPPDALAFAEVSSPDAFGDRKRFAKLVGALVLAASRYAPGSTANMPDLAASTDVGLTVSTRFCAGLVLAPSEAPASPSPAPEAALRGGSAAPPLDTHFVGAAKFPATPAGAAARGRLLDAVFADRASAKAMLTLAVAGRDVSVMARGGRLNAPAYAVVGNDLVWGDLFGVKVALGTVAMPEEKTLARQQAVASAAGRFAGRRSLLGFANLAPLAAQLKGAGADAEFAVIRPDAFRAVAVAAAFDGGTARVRAVVDVDRSKQGLLPILADPPAISTRAAGFVPRDADLSLTYGIDLARLFDLTEKDQTGVASSVLGFASPRELSEVGRTLLASLGLDLRNDVVGAFGDEVTVAVHMGKHSESGGADPPYAVSVVEIRRPEIVQLLVDKLEAALPDDAPGLPKVSQVAGADLWTLGGRAWAISDGYLVGGETRSVTAALAAHRQNASLASSPSFASEARYAPRNTGGLLYLSPSSLKELGRSGMGIPNLSSVLDFLTPNQGALVMVENEDTALAFDAVTLAPDRVPVGATPTTAADPIGRNEAFAVAQLRTIGSAEAAYLSATGEAGSFDDLVRYGALEKQWGRDTVREGYRFSVALPDGRDGRGSGTFTVSAVPVDYKTSGVRSFVIVEDFVIRAADRKGEPAAADDPPIGADNYGDPGPVPVSPLGSLVPIVDVVRFLGSETLREGAALGTLRTLAMSEDTYKERFGRYATLDELAEKKLVDPSFAAEPVKNGYRFSVAVSDDGKPEGGSSVLAVPERYGETGRLSYYMGNDWIVRGGDKGGDPATADDPAIDD